MSAQELRTILHKQIDSLQKEEDLQDLLLTVNEFISNRADEFQETPELKAQLERALESAKAGRLTPHDEVIKEAKQWLVR